MAGFSLNAIADSDDGDSLFGEVSRYGVAGTSDLSMPSCKTCRMTLSSVDTFCSICGFGIHALHSCAADVNGYVVSVVWTLRLLSAR